MMNGIMEPTSTTEQRPSLLPGYRSITLPPKWRNLLLLTSLLASSLVLYTAVTWVHPGLSVAPPMNESWLPGNRGNKSLFTLIMGGGKPLFQAQEPETPSNDSDPYTVPAGGSFELPINESELPAVPTAYIVQTIETVVRTPVDLSAILGGGVSEEPENFTTKPEGDGLPSSEVPVLEDLPQETPVLTRSEKCCKPPVCCDLETSTACYRKCQGNYILGLVGGPPVCPPSSDLEARLAACNATAPSGDSQLNQDCGVLGTLKTTWLTLLCLAPFWTLTLAFLALLVLSTAIEVGVSRVASHYRAKGLAGPGLLQRLKRCLESKQRRLSQATPKLSSLAQDLLNNTNTSESSPHESLPMYDHRQSVDHLVVDHPVVEHPAVQDSDFLKAREENLQKAYENISIVEDIRYLRGPERTHTTPRRFISGGPGTWREHLPAESEHQMLGKVSNLDEASSEGWSEGPYDTSSVPHDGSVPHRVSELKKRFEGPYSPSPDDFAAADVYLHPGAYRRSPEEGREELDSDDLDSDDLDYDDEEFLYDTDGEEVDPDQYSSGEEAEEEIIDQAVAEKLKELKNVKDQEEAEESLEDSARKSISNSPSPDPQMLTRVPPPRRAD